MSTTRYGIDDRDYARAEHDVDEIAHSDPPTEAFLVEVFDEETRYSERHGGDIGVVYVVVGAEDLERFQSEHDDSTVQYSAGPIEDD